LFSEYLVPGVCRNSTGDSGTDKLFTGQRLDDTGLYYYGARYYDANIGRFISPDPITHSEPLPKGQIIKGLIVYCALVQYYTGQTRNPLIINPQEHNRYSYALNNPFKYSDPDGHQIVGGLEYAAVGGVGMLYAIAYYFLVVAPALEQQGIDTSINNAISYAEDQVTKVVKQVAGAIGGFFKNLNPFKKNDNDKKPDNRLPQKVRDVVDYIKRNEGNSPPGYETPKSFLNKEGGLPTGTKYTEYDVNPIVRGQSRGPERIVIGEDKSVWYTSDHYKTFIRVE